MKTVTLETGTEDASRYLLTLTTSAGSAVNYFGELADNYSEPYDGEVRVHADGGKFSLTTPSVEDWYQLHLTMDGVTTTYARHSGSKLYNIAMPEGLKLASVGGGGYVWQPVHPCDLPVPEWSGGRPG